MLCCLSKRAFAGDADPSCEEAPFEIQSELTPHTLHSPVEKVELDPRPEDVPPILQPCAICARTFMPQSLEKHIRVCERQAAKKRKPFDSSKQRIQGTELAEFLPKQEKKRHYPDERSSKPKTSWKETHHEFLQAIRAAREEVVESPSQRQSGSLVTSGAPTRSNEQGLCPTCNRHFGIKAYERHVAWCKERTTRVVLSSATNVAKERLEARMRYRAPVLKSRRAITREKYSPSTVIPQNTKSSSMSSVKPKESNSAPSCNKSADSTCKQKPALVRRPGHAKESPSSTGPIKSRPVDRMDRLREEDLSTLSPRNPHPIKRISYLPVPPLKPRKDVFDDRKNIMLPQNYIRQQHQYERIDEVSECSEISSYRSRIDETNRTSARSQRMNIVSSRSLGNPKLNDVAVNADVVSMIVQPCTIYKEDHLVTWKQLSRGKHSQTQGNRKDMNARSVDVHFPAVRKERKADYSGGKGEVESGRTTIRNTRQEGLSSSEKLSTEKSSGNGSDRSWSEDEKLNETYLIPDMERCRKSKPVKHSPRIEFCLKDIPTYNVRDSLCPLPILSNANVNPVARPPENVLSSASTDTYVKSSCEPADMDEVCNDSYIKDDSNGNGRECEDQVSVYQEQVPLPNEEHRKPSPLVDMFADPTGEQLELRHETETESDTNLDNNLLSTNLLNSPDRSSTPIEDSRELHARNNVTNHSSQVSIPSAQVNPAIPEYSSMANSESACILLSEVNRAMLERQLTEIAVQANICGCFLKTPRDGQFSCRGECENCLTENNSSHKISDNTLGISAPIIERTDEAMLNETLKEDGDLNEITIQTGEKLSDESLIDPSMEIDNEIQTSYMNRNFDYDSDYTEGQDSQTFQTEPSEIPEDCQPIKTDHSVINPPLGSNLKLNRRTKSTGAPKPTLNGCEIDAPRNTACSIYPLRKSTDADRDKSKEVDFNEVETIEEIRTHAASLNRNVLPDIKGKYSEVIKNRHEEKQKLNLQNYWERASQAAKSQLINLDLPIEDEAKLFKRKATLCILPPVPHSPSLPKVSGAFKDYDPFLLAEQQMNELLSDTSDQSVTDGPLTLQNHDTLFPLSPSSAFVKYPYQAHSAGPGKRSSLIAPPTEFDDLTSDFSSDSTETNSLSREIFLKDLKESKELKQTLAKSPELKSPTRELGRRVIIDKSKALGGEVVEDCAARSNKNSISNSERGRKILGKVSPKVVKPMVNRSLSIRAASAPKPATERRNPCTSPGSAKKVSQSKEEVERASNTIMNNRNSNYMGLSGSNLSLSSIVSSEVDMKRSNSVFEELMTSFEDENGSFPSLRSLLKSDSLSLSSPVHDSRQRNGQLSDEDFSSPENYKRPEHSKHSADSAYSSLNRKYSQHGRTINDVAAGRLTDELPRNHRRDSGSSSSKCKLPNFCHACGTRFHETAKYCCECGLQRLAL